MGDHSEMKPQITAMGIMMVIKEMVMSAESRVIQMVLNDTLFLKML